MDVLDPVISVHCDVCPVGLQLLHSGLSNLLRGDGEVQSQILYIAIISLMAISTIKTRSKNKMYRATYLKVQEIFVQVWVE